MKIIINKKYSTDIENIISVETKKWGSVWVKYYNPTQKTYHIAKAQNDAGSFLCVVNQIRLSQGLKPIFEKK